MFRGVKWVYLPESHPWSPMSPQIIYFSHVRKKSNIETF